MDPLTVLVTALVTGAAQALKPTALRAFSQTWSPISSRAVLSSTLTVHRSWHLSRQLCYNDTVG